MVRKALSVLPTRPVLFIVPMLVVLVMSFYYWDIFSKCTSNKQFRASLNEALHSVGVAEQFRLMDVTDFRWDKVRVVANFKPERRNVECFLDWNWPSGERDSLIASELLSVLIFAQEGTIIEYHEVRSDEVSFLGADSSLTPQSAVFSVGKNSINSGGVTLTLNN